MGVGWEEERGRQTGRKHTYCPLFGNKLGNICVLKVGKCDHGEFLGKAAAVCKEYMARDPTSLSFTVLALTANE